MIDFHFIYTFSLILIMTVLLIKEVFEPDVIIFAVLILLMLGGVISIGEAFSGFANEGMLTVAFLFIVAGAVQQTGALNSLTDKLFNSQGSISWKLLRFLTPVTAVSAFFNNTPIVAMFIPVIRNWARKNDQSASKFMLPLSYAAILGGVCTLIGTSTTLVVHGLMKQSGMAGFSFFEITPVGLPVALLGLLFISLVGHHFIPDRQAPIVQLGENMREFVIVMKVDKDYKYIGRTIQQAGLRRLKGVYLFQIERNSTVIATVGPEEVILLGDRLFFTGLPDTIVDLQKTIGLSLLKDNTFKLKNYDSDILGTFEVVISANSPLIGKNVRESNFRIQYNAVILAIHRSGERIQKKIGDIVLRAGDTLLILSNHDFTQKWYHSKDFYLVSRAITPPSKPHFYVWFSFAVLAGMIIVMATGLLSILPAVCLASLVLVVSRCISPDDARRSIELNVLLVIASAFGISKALINSGVATFIAQKLIDYLGVFGPIGLITGIFFIASFYTEIITNNAAAALVFPIALSVIQQTNLDPRPFCITLAIAASASFATPIGYQTNMMVYGPGGYHFSDYLKIGIPMNIMVGITTILLVYTLYF
ncbi:MAG: SLC13 family permease [Calditrichaeota bacterium]|nr:MAG: SLC13 family permease [Calditrichota bacterium]